MRSRRLGRKPIPRPSYLDTCDYLGFVFGKGRWRSQNGTRLLTWDSLHGEIEVFNLRGKHVAVLDAISGKPRKGAIRGRRIDV
jgi:hypothetical protein